MNEGVNGSELDPSSLQLGGRGIEGILELSGSIMVP